MAAANVRLGGPDRRYVRFAGATGADASVARAGCSDRRHRAVPLQLLRPYQPKRRRERQDDAAGQVRRDRQQGGHRRLGAVYGKAAPAGCTVASCGYFANSVRPCTSTVVQLTNVGSRLLQAGSRPVQSSS